MTSITPENFFTGGGGAPTFKFDTPGDTLTGRITDLKVVQQREYSDGGVGDLKTWPSGDPMMQLNVTVQTTLRDPAIDDDDGKRRTYVDGKRIRDAVREALDAVGATHLEVGGDYTQTFTGYDPASKNPKNPAKAWQVRYQKPQVGKEFFAAPVQAAPAAAPQQAAAAPEDALQAALANLSPEVKAALLAQAKAG